MNFLGMGAGAAIWAVTWAVCVACVFAHFGGVLGVRIAKGEDNGGGVYFAGSVLIVLMLIEFCLFHNPVPFAFFGAMGGFFVAYLRAFQRTNAAYRLPLPDDASGQTVGGAVPEEAHSAEREVINAETIRRTYFPAGTTLQIEFKTPEDARRVREYMETKLMNPKPEDARP
jgi:hypothetical protein